jgi:hypothetical protein
VGLIGWLYLIVFVATVSTCIIYAKSWSQNGHRFGSSGDGEYPAAGVIMDALGILYGTTAEGDSSSGTVFQLIEVGGMPPRSRRGSARLLGLRLGERSACLAFMRGTSPAGRSRTRGISRRWPSWRGRRCLRWCRAG